MSVEKELAGRVAVVTGGSRNIGRAIALSLAEGGAAVVITAVQAREEAEAVANEIRASGGRSAVHFADLSDPEQAREIVSAAVETFGGLDILVHNAAVRREAELTDISYQDWREVLSIILDAAFLLAQAAAPHLSVSGAGTIVNIGGMAAHAGAPRRPHVMAAKAGLVGLTRGLAHDLAGRQITVNCVVPGMIETVRGRSATAGRFFSDKKPPLIGRRGLPDEIASLVRYLSGPHARYLTGQTIHANGGGFMP